MVIPRNISTVKKQATSLLFLFIGDLKVGGADVNLQPDAGL